MDKESIALIVFAVCQDEIRDFSREFVRMGMWPRRNRGYGLLSLVVGSTLHPPHHR